MSDAAIVYLVLAAVVALFIWNKLPVEVVAVGSALTLAATGVLSLDQALAGFGDTTVLFIAALFVVSEGIDSTGVTTWAGQQLIDRGRSEQDEADHPDDAARRIAHRGNQCQRGGGGAAARWWW